MLVVVTLEYLLSRSSRTIDLRDRPGDAGARLRQSRGVRDLRDIGTAAAMGDQPEDQPADRT